ncbi:hypothetical protein VP01_2733g2 [Puccinia sorghi]|uniref:Major facilitator superfamily (MFS) profile domain-containing protein n=1 Tax=Puccinia sorghi TaxID=27349 RepID=A0A0L6V515_9BASI|nr:hypothetical protein VP01_2733g2 [Puccinia sorghi]
MSREEIKQQKHFRDRGMASRTISITHHHPTATHALSLPSPQPKPISLPRALAMIIICVTAFVVSNATSLSLNLLIPSIQRELDIEASDLQWISSGFPLGFGSCLLLSGRLADLVVSLPQYGHKLFIQVGTIVYAMASLGCALSHTHVQLSILRVLQGLGAAATAPSLIGVLGNHLPPESSLKRVGFACLSAGAPLGGTFGLLVGGFITQGTGPGWRSFFFLCCASAICVCVSATLIIPKDKPREDRERSIDWIGAILIITGLTALTFSLGISSREGWGRVTVLLPFIASILLLGNFVFWQHILEKRMNQFLLVGEGWSKPTQPILKLNLFRRDHHRFSIVLIVVCLLCCLMLTSPTPCHSTRFPGAEFNAIGHPIHPHVSIRRMCINDGRMHRLVLGLLLNITFGFLLHIIPGQLLSPRTRRMLPGRNPPW